MRTSVVMLVLMATAPFSFSGCTPEGSAADAGAAEGDSGRRDAGPAEDGGAVTDAEAPDAGALASDAGPMEPVDCAALVTPTVQLCSSSATRCEVVFTGGEGCAAVCASAGLGCVSSWEDAPMCLADRGRPELGCLDTGHDSDFCVCGLGECAPVCDGRTCGSDGCGGSCGDCATGETCSPDGSCAASARPWEDLLAGRVGFGRTARGGEGHDVCWVENTNDSGSGSLRSCAERGRTWVRFRVGGVIRLSTPIDVASETTIDGRDAPITITNKGLYLQGVEHVILHGFTMRDGTGDPENDDGVRLRDASDVWIDHLTLSAYPDGLLDITRESTRVTVSWSDLSDHGKVMLISASVSHSTDAAIRVTLHHNRFHDSNSRHPRLRWGQVHAFNNLWERWGSYGVAASHRSQFLSENNVFVAGRDREAIITNFGSDPDHGEVRSVGDVTRNGATIVMRNPDAVFSPAYPYTAEPAGDALVSAILGGVGAP